MISMEPVLKRGYSTWDRHVLPPDEYSARVDAVCRALAERHLAALVVVNYSLLGALFDYADIAYLSGVQSGGALLIVPGSEPALVSFGGGRELFFLRTQTWITDISPGAGKPFDVIADKLRSRRVTSGAIGVVGTAAMPAHVQARFTEALGGHELTPFDADLQALRATKRPREVMAVRIAKGIADDAIAAGLGAFDAGGDNTAAMLQAERVARLGKARDVRVLASMGGTELRPFEGRLDGRHAPLRLWVAAQYQGYWAEAVACHPSAGPTSADEAVDAMRSAARAGATAGAVADAALQALGAAADTALSYGLGGTIGLAHNEGLTLRPGNAQTLAEGALLALRVHVPAGPTPSLASTIISVGRDRGRPIEPLRL
jgi:Xaa-Pro aminopeptidase